ncbi:MAG: tRNA (guanosine(46)-N7)-methyltransferase TrmB [Rickettsiales bacterium]|jgi:tRNA (guanine-N7-)-methyltransferase|nr:tRNA (guanosine(46)-N7)-methyltransferase TrmB [Rickettsiales bacterium]
MVILDNRKNVRSFGRINSRGVLKSKENVIENILPKYSIGLDYPINPDIVNHLEVGFGHGESMAERAKKNENINYIGCETYVKGVLDLLDIIVKNNLKNINIFNGDARLLLENLKNDSLDMIFILFPDPWPKKKHHRRRIINEDFLHLVSEKLKTGGQLFFSSDIDAYVEYTIEMVVKTGYFKELFDKNNCGITPEWWVETKYQKKAMNTGRISKFLTWEKL